MSIEVFTIDNPTVLLDGKAVSVKVTQAVLTLEATELDQLDLVLTNDKDRILPNNSEEMRFNVSGISDGKQVDFELTGGSLIHQTINRQFMTTVLGTCRKLSDKHK